MMKGLYTLLGILLLCALSVSQSSAAWTETKTVVSGNWGTDYDEFGLREIYYREQFPQFFDVDELGNVAIADPVNLRVKLYDHAGTLLSIIRPSLPYEDQVEWPHGAIRIGQRKLAVNYKRDGVQIYDYSGTLLKTLDDSGSLLPQNLPEGQFLTSYKRLYTADGTLVDKNSDMLTFSYDLKEEKVWSERYQVFHRAEGNIRIYSHPQLKKVFTNDIGQLFAIAYDQPEGLAHVSTCGKIGPRFNLPERQWISLRPDSIGDWSGSDYAPDYGPPQATPSGDVMLWKKTPEGFSLLRWSWDGELSPLFDAPYYPRFLVAAPINDGILLSWDTSYSDPGCVTSYQIARSTVSGGPYEPLGTVLEGELSFVDRERLSAGTYFYVVRALNGNIPSGYSNESIVEVRP